MYKFLLVGTRKHPNAGYHSMYGFLAVLLLLPIFLPGDHVDGPTIVNLVSADVVICLIWAGLVWHRKHFVNVDELRDFLEGKSTDVVVVEISGVENGSEKASTQPVDREPRE